MYHPTAKLLVIIEQKPSKMAAVRKVESRLTKPKPLPVKPNINFDRISLSSHVVGPCHHGMARPQVADRGTASDKQGSCEYIE